MGITGGYAKRLHKIYDRRAEVGGTGSGSALTTHPPRRTLSGLVLPKIPNDIDVVTQPSQP